MSRAEHADSRTSGGAHRRPTLRTVAEAAGVSTATVSYVFSGRRASGAGVAEDTVRRVLEAADRLNYRPNTAARAIRTGRTGTVQLSLHMLSDPWSLAVVEAVNAEANRHGLTTLILADGDWNAALDRIECDVAYLDQADGSPESRDKLRALASRGQRLVVFSETLEPDGFDVIRSDAIPGCEMAMAHLLEDHTVIGCLAAERGVAESAERTTRYTPYVRALEGRGIPLDPGLTATYRESSASAFDGALDLLSRAERPTAIYATTDFAAIAAINAAHRLGLSVPHDVAIVGVGNTPDAHLVAPTLTTVGPSDFYRRQARIIVRRALGEDAGPPRVHEFAWSLFRGGSTDLSAPRR